MVPYPSLAARLAISGLFIASCGEQLAQTGSKDQQLPPFKLSNQVTYQQLLTAGTAAEILRHELSLQARPRIAAVVALLMAFAESNPNATPAQLEAYALAVSKSLAEIVPSDPNLTRMSEFLPAVRFGAEGLSLDVLRGTNVRIGRDALALLGLAPYRTTRSLRAMDFERAQSVDFSNHAPLAHLMTLLMLDQKVSGRGQRGLSTAVKTFAQAEGIDVEPQDLASLYPSVALALESLPPDYAAYLEDRDDAFASLRDVVDAETGALDNRINVSIEGVEDALLEAPDLFANVPDPVVVEQVRQREREALLLRTTSRAVLTLSTVLMEQSNDAAQREAARQTREFSHIQLQTDQTMGYVRAGITLGAIALVGGGQLSKGDVVSGMSAMLLVVDGVLGLVGPSAPTPEEQIFSQIVELREQVEAFRVEMHQRFDSIDQQLNLIYESMASGLNQLNETTRRIDGNVQQISVDLYALRSSLTGLEANLYGVLSSGFEKSFIEDMETGLGYRQRTGVDLKYEGQGENTFFAFHSRFFARATSVAADEVYAGPATTTLTNDASAAQVLRSFPLGYHINNLRTFPVQLGIVPWSISRVANPTTWSLAADAYAQLAAENPWYFAMLNRNDPTRLEDVIATGVAVRHVMRGARDGGVIEALLSQYKARVAALGEAIELSPTMQRLGYPPGFDPFGGLERDMRGQGPGFSQINPSSGDVLDIWFDPSLAWELFDSRLGLAAASKLPGWGLNRYTLSYRNTYTEFEEDEPQYYFSLTLRDLEDGPYPKGYKAEVVYYDFLDATPEDFYNWLPDGEAVEALMRATVIGQHIPAGEYTLVYGGRNQFLGPILLPSESSVLQQMQAVADEYWDETADALSSSPILELFESLTSSQELLGAYVSMGLPETLEKNDIMRAALKGAPSQRSGLGGEWLKADFDGALASGARPPTFVDALHTRADVLFEQLEPALEGDEHETHAYLEWSLQSLQSLQAHALELSADDTYVVSRDTTLSVDAANGVLVNDAQQPGAVSITVALRTPAQHGLVVLKENGAFSYTPVNGFFGQDVFYYGATATLADSGEASVDAAPAAVLIHVQ